MSQCFNFHSLTIRILVFCDSVLVCICIIFGKLSKDSKLFNNAKNKLKKVRT